MYIGIDSAEIVDQVIKKPSAHIVYPQVQGVSVEAGKLINKAIEDTLKSLIIMLEWYDEGTLTLEVSYEVKLNEKGLLSLLMQTFATVEHAAHPTTIVRSLTVDLNTGEVYELYDFFRNMSGHALKITNYILKEIKYKDIQLIVELTLIPDNHPYYLTKHDLVIYFQEGEIAPRSYGFLEFKIPYSYLQSILEIDSPLERLL